MRKRVLLLVGALCAGTISRAQTTQPLPVAPTEITLTRADTARAVHELFKSRRGGAAAWLGLGIAGLAASILPAQQSTSAGVWTPGVVAGTAFVGIGLNKSIGFWWSKERMVMRNLAATGHLPPNIRRRLKGEFVPLRGMASDPNPLLATGVPLPVDTTSATTPTKISIPFAGVATSGYTLADSLDAVAALFSGKRLAGQLPVLAVLPAARLLSGSSEADRQYNVNTGQYEESKPSAGAVIAGLGLAIGGVTYMFVHNAPYSNAKYAELVAASQAGAPIPTKWRAQLKPKHFGQGRELRNKMLRREARKNRNK
ncbi:hypothetical protein ACFPAF_20990 [Hymenobacter endophyticus]|uniref:DUF4235 domain-containing protein n=1 Tax=Hymenobacter endophyticus TaxID=3076335 RepID=A0ABU3TNH7_9BACT|nr:hypothetical protein [Hymenobacter endophyticus]MDU0372888.1 hypothetical protein [Hymenobacter endophyticus]